MEKQKEDLKEYAQYFNLVFEYIIFIFIKS